MATGEYTYFVSTRLINHTFQLQLTSTCMEVLCISTLSNRQTSLFAGNNLTVCHRNTDYILVHVIILAKTHRRLTYQLQHRNFIIIQMSRHCQYRIRLISHRHFLTGSKYFCLCNGCRQTLQCNTTVQRFPQKMQINHITLMCNIPPREVIIKRISGCSVDSFRILLHPPSDEIHYINARLWYGSILLRTDIHHIVHSTTRTFYQ